MKKESKYIMREQVENLIPSLMEQDVTLKPRQGDGYLHLVSVGIVTFVYFITMALSGY
ncbi:MAG: hypothetical protein RPU64_04390 [Candidatus Sedimenticola sp. (ex Thyasira tokunagai)]